MNQTIAKINVARPDNKTTEPRRAQWFPLPKSYKEMNGFTECYQKRKVLFSTANILVINTKQTCY